MSALYRLAWLLVPLAVAVAVGLFVGRAFAAVLAGMPQ